MHGTRFAASRIVISPWTHSFTSQATTIHFTQGRNPQAGNGNGRDHASSRQEKQEAYGAFHLQRGRNGAAGPAQEQEERGGKKTAGGRAAGGTNRQASARSSGETARGAELADDLMTKDAWAGCVR